MRKSSIRGRLQTTGLELPEVSGAGGPLRQWGAGFRINQWLSVPVKVACLGSQRPACRNRAPHADNHGRGLSWPVTLGCPWRQESTAAGPLALTQISRAGAAGPGSRVIAGLWCIFTSPAHSHAFYPDTSCLPLCTPDAMYPINSGQGEKSLS